MSYVHLEEENCMVLAQVVNEKSFQPTQIKSMKMREAVKLTVDGPDLEGF